MIVNVLATVTDRIYAKTETIDFPASSYQKQIDSSRFHSAVSGANGFGAISFRSIVTRLWKN